MTLFQTGDFTLASGAKSSWKIECDALTTADWEGLAAIAVQYLSPFSDVEGVPRGGLPFAAALARYIKPSSWYILIAEDVVTTGGSIEKFRARMRDDYPIHYDIVGVCVFARGKCPDWVTPLFQMPLGK